MTNDLVWNWMGKVKEAEELLAAEKPDNALLVLLDATESAKKDSLWETHSTLRNRTERFVDAAKKQQRHAAAIALVGTSEEAKISSMLTQDDNCLLRAIGYLANGDLIRSQKFLLAADAQVLTLQSNLLEAGISEEEIVKKYEVACLRSNKIDLAIQFWRKAAARRYSNFRFHSSEVLADSPQYIRLKTAYTKIIELLKRAKRDPEAEEATVEMMAALTGNRPEKEYPKDDRKITSDTFWEIIEESIADAKLSSVMDILFEKLLSLRPAQIIAFHNHYLKLHAKAYTQKLWAAAYLIMDGCSDDSFADFRSGLILQGRKRFESALKNPDSIADWIDEDTLDIRSEEMNSLALDAYEEKTGSSGEEKAKYPAEPLSGSDWDDCDLPKLLPALFAKIEEIRTDLVV